MAARWPRSLGIFVGAVLMAALLRERRAGTPVFPVAPAAAAVPQPVPVPDPIDVEKQPDRAESGRVRSFHLAHGNDGPATNAWVYIPRAFDPAKPLHVAIAFHGFKNCIGSYVSAGGRACTHGGEPRTGYDLPAQVEKSGTGAIFVVPELAFDQKSSDPGKLGRPDGLRLFLQELVESALTPDIGPRTYGDIARVMLLASSGGYQALLPALANGGVARVRDVYLLDAFYVDTSALSTFLRARPSDFLPGATDPKHFGLIFCRKSGTARQSRDFGDRLGTFMNANGAGDSYAFKGWSWHPTIEDLRVPAFVYMSHLEHDQVVREYLSKLLTVSGI